MTFTLQPLSLKQPVVGAGEPVVEELGRRLRPPGRTCFLTPRDLGSPLGRVSRVWVDEAEASP